MLVSYLDYSPTLNMEAICSSETSVDVHRSTRRYSPEDRTLHACNAFIYTLITSFKISCVKILFALLNFYSKSFTVTEGKWDLIGRRRFKCRSQWPRGLSHEPSSLARTLGSWVRIPLEAWISVCVYSVFVLFCVKIAVLRRADLPPKDSYRLCID
jgi:hypothetical protein